MFTCRNCSVPMERDTHYCPACFDGVTYPERCVHTARTLSNLALEHWLDCIIDELQAIDEHDLRGTLAHTRFLDQKAAVIQVMNERSPATGG